MVRMYMISESAFEEKTIINSDPFPSCDSDGCFFWIDVEGVANAAVMEKIGVRFQIHPLVLEDIMNTTMRPKSEEFEHHHFFVMRMLTYTAKSRELGSEQVSFILGSHYLISFQEGIEGDVFEDVRAKLRANKGRVRKGGPDYLAYLLADCITDQYFTIIEQLGELVDELEDELIKDPDRATLGKIYQSKREFLELRRAIWPLREVISQLQRGDTDLIRREVQPYFRDVYDHVVQLIDTIETYRDILGGMLDTYLSSLSNKLNEVMKVLTIISTIFIPLSFIAGVYGMNFDNMPELHAKYGYYIAWVLMLLTGGGFLIFFRRRKWI